MLLYLMRRFNVPQTCSMGLFKVEFRPNERKWTSTNKQNWRVFLSSTDKRWITFVGVHLCSFAFVYARSCSMELKISRSTISWCINLQKMVTFLRKQLTLELLHLGIIYFLIKVGFLMNSFGRSINKCRFLSYNCSCISFNILTSMHV